MQTLYGLIGGKDPEDKINVPKEDFETLDCPGDQTINQIHRKIKLLIEFKEYIKQSYRYQNSVFYKYIINTTIHEFEDKKQIVLPNLFGTLHIYNISSDFDELNIALMELL
jgi:hypothetical protein